MKRALLCEKTVLVLVAATAMALASAPFAQAELPNMVLTRTDTTDESASASYDLLTMNEWLADSTSAANNTDAIAWLEGLIGNADASAQASPAKGRAICNTPSGTSVLIPTVQAESWAHLVTTALSGQWGYARAACTTASSVDTTFRIDPAQGPGHSDDGTLRGLLNLDTITDGSATSNFISAWTLQCGNSYLAGFYAGDGLYFIAGTVMQNDVPTMVYMTAAGFAIPCDERVSVGKTVTVYADTWSESDVTTQGGMTGAWHHTHFISPYASFEVEADF